MSVSAIFDTNYYLTNNADVVVAISQGHFGSAIQHYNDFGGKELRAPNSTFNPTYYAINNSDVLNAVSAGTFGNVFAHYQEFGETENRAPNTNLASFDSAGYLTANTDVAAAITAGSFNSALDHFIAFGQTEGRTGSGVTEATNPGSAINFTTGVDALVGTDGSDTFTADNSGGATTDTLTAADTVNGGAGTDTVRFFGTANILPTTLTSVENVYLNNPGASTVLNFSTLTDVTSIELDNTEITGANAEVLTLAQGQALTLDSVVDNTGGGNTMAIAGATTLVSLDLTVDGAGAGANDLALTIDDANNLATLNITASGTASDISYADADNAVTTINVAGSIGLALGTTTTNVATVNASSMTAGGLTVDLGVSAGATSVTGSAANDDITADAAVAYTINMGAGTDRLTTGANITVTDTLDGGDGVDTIETSGALTNALVARISNFEVLDIGGSANLTHDLGDFTGLTVLEVDGAATGGGGDVTITDLVETALVRINAALGDGLVVNQANSTVGSPADSITVSFENQTSITTGQELEIDAVETITLNSLSSGSAQTHTLSNFQADSASTLDINATTARLTITSLDAVDAVLIDNSDSTQNTSITSAAVTFTGAFLYNGGSGTDTLVMEGATTVAGSIYSLGNGRDSITLDAGNNVAVDIRSSATDASGAIASLVDVGAANTAGFVSATTDFDYNGALNNDGVTTVTTSAAATITAALANDNDATNFLAALAGGNDALEAALTTYAGAQTAANANAAEAAAITAIGAVANLDSLLTSSEAVLFTVDSETNDSAGVANDGASAVFRFVNSTTTGNAINTGELELIFVTQDGALVAGDFI
jgi:hypothetical protein